VASREGGCGWAHHLALGEMLKLKSKKSARFVPPRKLAMTGGGRQRRSFRRGKIWKRWPSEKQKKKRRRQFTRAAGVFRGHKRTCDRTSTSGEYKPLVGTNIPTGRALNGRGNRPNINSGRWSSKETMRRKGIDRTGLWRRRS